MNITKSIGDSELTCSIQRSTGIILWAQILLISQ